MQSLAALYLTLGGVVWLYLCVVNPHLPNGQLFLRALMWLPILATYFVRFLAGGLAYAFICLVYHRDNSNKNVTTPPDVPKIGTNR